VEHHHPPSIVCHATQLNSPLRFEEFVSNPDDGTRLILEPEAGLAMNSISLHQPRIQLCVGPEGGFSTNEIGMAENNSFIVARLGPRVMRTETAAIMALGVAQTLWGDLG